MIRETITIKLAPDIPREKRLLDYLTENKALGFTRKESILKLFEACTFSEDALEKFSKQEEESITSSIKVSSPKEEPIKEEENTSINPYANIDDEDL